LKGNSRVLFSAKSQQATQILSVYRVPKSNDNRKLPKYKTGGLNTELKVTVKEFDSNISPYLSIPTVSFLRPWTKIPGF